MLQLLSIKSYAYIYKHGISVNAIAFLYNMRIRDQILDFSLVLIVNINSGANSFVPFIFFSSK